MITSELIKRIRSVSRENGWAIGVHGTLKRDIDLIAAPWTEDACDWIDLWLKLSKEVPLWRGGIEKKPHGRMGCIMLQPGSEIIKEDGREIDYKNANFNPPQIDISFLAKQASQP